MKPVAVATPLAPAYTVLRITKLTTWDAVTAAGKCDGAQLLLGAGGPGLFAAVRSLIGTQTVRTNAVLAVQVLMSVARAPLAGQPATGGEWSGDRLQAWTEASISWLRDKYGDRLALATLDAGGPAPVILSILVPLDERGKLNARALFGGTRLRLAQLQSEYAASVEALGIKRGGEATRAAEAATNEVAALKLQLLAVLGEKADLQGRLAQLEGEKRSGASAPPTEEAFRAELERRGQVRLVP
ncbi:plasmid recombination protein [Cupriavidus necator]